MRHDGLRDNRPRHTARSGQRMPPRARCQIVPPYLLEHIARLDTQHFEPAASAARRSLESTEPFRLIREERTPTLRRMLTPEGDRSRPQRRISDAENTEKLPGTLVRSEGDAPTSDRTVNEAYDGLGKTHAMYWSAFERASVDDNGMLLEASVHYGIDYDNAFWDGHRMVFGDGDAQIFAGFTASLSVIGHELTHGVTQHSANLAYNGQSGALNESISDVFGALVEQFAHGQETTEASWLIGEGIFTAEVEGNALRSLKAPGTAYDDDVLGKDPQPGTMDDYVTTRDDNGGVHLNSGIPNHAFYLVADAIGGKAWEHAGVIWYDAITNGKLGRRATFAEFASATRDAAIARFGERSRESDAVADAWEAVGVRGTIPA